MNNPAILVLGATGNIGSAIVHQLRSRDLDFVGGAPLTDLGKLTAQGIRAADVDFNDRITLDNAMRGVTRLFMLLPLEEKMTAWARNILDSAKSSGIEFIVRSSLIDADPDSPYFAFRIHGEIDRMVRESGIPCAIVHPNSFMQNYINYYGSTIIHDNAIFLSHGDAKISCIDVNDIAAVDTAILADPSGHEMKEYTVTGPQALSNREIAAILSQVTGRKIRYVPVSDEDVRRSLSKIGVPSWNIEATESFNRHIRDGKQETVTDDVRRLTGKDPNTFMQFALAHAGAWKQPVYAET